MFLQHKDTQCINKFFYIWYIYQTENTIQKKNKQTKNDRNDKMGPSLTQKVAGSEILVTHHFQLELVNVFKF